MSYDDPDNQNPDIQHAREPPRREQIDLVHSDDAQASDGACPPDQLHVCFHCAGELVYPAGLVRGGPPALADRPAVPRVRVKARGRLRAGGRRASRRRARPRGGALLGDLRRMTHANMSDEIEFFVRALDADLIDPLRF